MDRVEIFIAVVIALVFSSGYYVSELIMDELDKNETKQVICLQAFSVFQYRTVKGNIYCKVDSKWIYVAKESDIE